MDTPPSASRSLFFLDFFFFLFSALKKPMKYRMPAAAAASTAIAPIQAPRLRPCASGRAVVVGMPGNSGMDGSVGISGMATVGMGSMVGISGMGGTVGMSRATVVGISVMVGGSGVVGGTYSAVVGGTYSTVVGGAGGSTVVGGSVTNSTVVGGAGGSTVVGACTVGGSPTMAQFGGSPWTAVLGSGNAAVFKQLGGPTIANVPEHSGIDAGQVAFVRVEFSPARWQPPFGQYWKCTQAPPADAIVVAHRRWHSSALASTDLAVPAMLGGL
mmetsp:Transcript_24532/g.64747  ORF Transcript_24532/g.64747 Transcript_24532/m.64747 type:complete len:271 (+) Transcript_24532:356-1168(+)